VKPITPLEEVEVCQNYWLCCCGIALSSHCLIGSQGMLLKM